MSSPEPLAGLDKIAPYKGGGSEIEDLSNYIKLASNEGAFGPSPKTNEALKACYYLVGFCDMSNILMAMDYLSLEEKDLLIEALSNFETKHDGVMDMRLDQISKY